MIPRRLEALGTSAGERQILEVERARVPQLLAAAGVHGTGTIEADVQRVGEPRRVEAPARGVASIVEAAQVRISEAWSIRR